MTRRRFRVSAIAQRRVAWLLQMGLVGMLFIGIDRLDLGIIVNAGIGLGVTQLPPLLERDYGIAMDPGLTLWITGAVFFHALGTVGLPGSRLGFYATVWWYDHLTHALSASVVAAVGYATTRAVDLHRDDIYLPPRFTFVFVLLFTIAFGVFWEEIEFGVAQLAALTGSGSILVQYGLQDTMMDLLFDILGGVVVGIWGTAYLTDFVGTLTSRFATLENR